MAVAALWARAVLSHHGVYVLMDIARQTQRDGNYNNIFMFFSCIEGTASGASLNRNRRARSFRMSAEFPAASERSTVGNSLTQRARLPFADHDSVAAESGITGEPAL